MTYGTGHIRATRVDTMRDGELIGVAGLIPTEHGT